MALIKCAECGQDISDQAPSCPHCGYVLSKEQSNQTISVNEMPDLNIKKIEQTGKFWKAIKMMAWFLIIIGIITASSSAKNSLGSSFGWTVFVFGLISFVVSKLGNWWERG